MSKPTNILALSLFLSLASLSAQEVQLINAVSTPEISVSINGQSFYPVFPQGLYTAGSATHSENVSYKIQNPHSGISRTLTVNLPPHSRQALVIYGNFSLSPEAHTKRKTSVANIHLFPLDYALTKQETRLRYRVINLLPGKTLQLITDTEPTRIPFEQSFSLSNQKPLTTLTIKIDEETIPILIHQRRILRNCDLIFYPDANGQLRLIRFFEPGNDANNEPDTSPTEE